MSSSTQAQLDETAVQNFREYLRIKSVQPNVNYDDCVTFLQKQANALDLPMQVHRIHPSKPIVVLKWVGTEPTLPAIMLNSHMDVVPVLAEEQWKYPPFNADIDEFGNIYARGSQDMKCVGIQYLEAIRRMKLAGQRLKRTLQVTFVPDEEIGGKLGMKDFVHTKEFQDLNIGFAFDEGVASPTNDFMLYYGERTTWHVEITCTGFTGHGSLLVPNTAGEKLRYVIDRFMDLRAEQMNKLNGLLHTHLGNVTTINLTQLEGGKQANVIPPSLKAMFDIRIDSSINPDSLEERIRDWCKEAGAGVSYAFEQKNPAIEDTKLDDSNKYWVAFKKACDNNDIHIIKAIFPAATDSRYIRQIGIPALGFSPINNTEILAHAINEHLNKDIFLKGIGIYMKILAEVGNI